MKNSAQTTFGSGIEDVIGVVQFSGVWKKVGNSLPG
jgi:hypothetical protein